MHRSKLPLGFIEWKTKELTGCLPLRSGQVHSAASVGGHENSSDEVNGNLHNSIKNVFDEEQYFLYGQDHFVKTRHMQRRSLMRCGKVVSAIPGPSMKSFDDLKSRKKKRIYFQLVIPCTLTTHEGILDPPQ